MLEVAIYWEEILKISVAIPENGGARVTPLPKEGSVQS